MKGIIITTFREGIGIDNNFFNLIEAMEKFDNIKLPCRMVGGSYKGISEFSLFIESTSKLAIHEAEKMVEKYFQECYLIILDNTALMVYNDGLHIHQWKRVTREVAVNNGDYTWDFANDAFYILS